MSNTLSRRVPAARALLLLALCASALMPGTRPLSAQPLFRSDTVLSLTLTTNLRDLLRERDSTKLRWHNAELAYAEGDSVRRIAVEVRARGHFRRQRGNCDFPPISIKLSRDSARGTLLQGNPRLKLTTSCRPNNDEFTQYILAEYGVYRAYRTLHSNAPRTRLANVTYRDSANRQQPVTSVAFFIEMDEEVARETSVKLRDQLKGARFADVDSTSLHSISLFEYMVGNTDWSLGGLHNIYLLQDTMGIIYPVAYDWDWSGIVNTSYSRPDYRLPIKRVTERHYMGPCLTLAQWAPTLNKFREQRAAIEASWTSIPGIAPRRVQQVQRYLSEFWETIDDPGRMRSTVLRTCRPEGN
ncbi:MAG: hypothetical protein MUD17_10350 [Gemmatimonadaceae bacterium]|jgi:hypothetical protein|nr:hypothetical protein [Gemmatimonadaceae bacterium]